MQTVAYTSVAGIAGNTLRWRIYLALSQPYTLGIEVVCVPAAVYCILFHSYGNSCEQIVIVSSIVATFCATTSNTYCADTILSHSSVTERVIVYEVVPQGILSTTHETLATSAVCSLSIDA